MYTKSGARQAHHTQQGFYSTDFEFPKTLNSEHVESGKRHANRRITRLGRRRGHFKYYLYEPPKTVTNKSITNACAERRSVEIARNYNLSPIPSLNVFFYRSAHYNRTRYPPTRLIDPRRFSLVNW